MARGIHVFENFCSFFLLCIGVFLEGQTILVVFFLSARSPDEEKQKSFA
jgi:hypothetical protein